MLRHALACLLAVPGLTACLESPPPRDALDAGLDAGPPLLRITSVVVTDRGGTVWPGDATPRSPVIDLALTDPIAQDPEAVLLLLRGGADETLRRDLDAAPLRATTTSRAMHVILRSDGDRLTLTPTTRMERGESFMLALVGGAQGASGGVAAPQLWPLTVARTDEAGTAPLGAWPADGTSGVSTSLPAVALHFDGPLEARAGIALRSRDRVIPTTSAPVGCAALGWDGGACLILTLEGPLAPSQEHWIEVAEHALDPTGAPLGPWRASFVTATDRDRSAPRLVQTTQCAIDEGTTEQGCVLADDTSVTLSLIADEPVRAELRMHGRSLFRLAPRGEATLRMHGLAPGEAHEATLVLTNLAGLEARHVFTLTTPARLDALTITEVRSNPAGPEPHQEYVEVLNYGDVTVELSGIALSDRPDVLGDVIERPISLAAGQRVLLVADRFDPDDVEDTPVPPGVPLVRLGSSIASGGLTNAGEPLFLRDAAGRRLSATPPRALPEGLCLARRPGGGPRVADPGSFDVRPCRPGRP